MKDKLKSHALRQQIMASLESTLPVLFSRKEVPKLFGGCIAPGTLANLGIKNGPPYIRRGKHAIYEKESFLAWFRTWLEQGDENA